MKRKPQSPEKGKLELYVAKIQTGYSAFETNLAAIGPGGILQVGYKRFDPESACDFYESIRCELEGNEKDLALHCNGHSSVYSAVRAWDGFFGRPLIVQTTDIFLRNLIARERDFLQHQFDAYNKVTGLRIKLVD
jgi:hypothetical protein